MHNSDLLIWMFHIMVARHRELCSQWCSSHHVLIIVPPLPCQRRLPINTWNHILTIDSDACSCGFCLAETDFLIVLETQGLASDQNWTTFTLLFLRKPSMSMGTNSWRFQVLFSCYTNWPGPVENSKIFPQRGLEAKVVQGFSFWPQLDIPTKVSFSALSRFSWKVKVEQLFPIEREGFFLMFA